MIINLTEDEKFALNSVDEQELYELIRKAILDQQASVLYRLSLQQCGTYVATGLRNFEDALADYRGAKSAKKVERTHLEAIRQGNRLSSAISQMKQRMQTEVEQGERFFVNDHIFWPNSFSQNLSVTVAYRWKPSPNANWEHGRITFHHKYSSRPALGMDTTKRKLSARKQKENEQEAFASTWQHLRDLSLLAVRDFFTEGGDGKNIPETFQAIPDGYRQGLNNYSTRFWSEKSE